MNDRSLASLVRLSITVASAETLLLPKFIPLTEGEFKIRQDKKKAREKMHLRGTIRREGRTENWYSNAKGEVVFQSVMRLT